MKLGNFSPEISSGSVQELFEKMRKYGFAETQFDFISVCGEEMPDKIETSLIDKIAREAKKNNIRIAAINGTFNMAHPDKAVRDDGIRRFEQIARICGPLSCSLVTLCTGTRNRDSMWVSSPDNETPEAWKDMTDSMEQVIRIAEKYDLTLGLETEASNVGNTPQKMKKLIEEMNTRRLAVIMDCANLFRPGMAKRGNVQRIIGEAFELLGEYTVLAHGKDIKEGDDIEFTGAGQGIIDFDFFLRELDRIGYTGGMVLHGIKKEEDIPGCVRYMQNR